MNPLVRFINYIVYSFFQRLLIIVIIYIVRVYIQTIFKLCCERLMCGPGESDVMFDQREPGVAAEVRDIFRATSRKVVNGDYFITAGK